MSSPEKLDLPSVVQQHLFVNATETAQALALTVANALRDGLRERGKASLVVSGGRTPELFQRHLSKQELDWSNVDVVLADDRWLPSNHIDSNEYFVRQNLLCGPAAAANFIPLVNTALAPEQHLSPVEQLLLAIPRPFDAVVLGVGDDGHTASLFPDADEISAAVDLRHIHRVALITPRSAPYQRITLTLRALLDANTIMILINGEPKRTAIEHSVNADPSKFALSTLLKQENVPVQLFYNR